MGMSAFILESDARSVGVGLHVDVLAAFLACGKHYDAVNKGEKSVVLTHAYIEAGMMDSTTLTLDDVTGFAVRTTKNFHSKSFAF